MAMGARGDHGTWVLGPLGAGVPWVLGSPGCRVPRVPAQVTCVGALSFQRKVERFLEAPSEATPPDSATGRAIALVNCCPPFR